MTTSFPTNHKSSIADTKMENKSNVLLNNCVLNTIFKYLRPRDLKSSRQVHSTWRSEAKRKLIPKTCIQLYDRADQNSPDEPKSLPMIFSSYVHQMQNFGHSYFCLSFSHNRERYDPALFFEIRNFITKLGNDIKTARIQMFFDNDEDTEVFNTVMDGIPNAINITFEFGFSRKYIKNLKFPPWLKLKSEYSKFSLALQINPKVLQKHFQSFKELPVFVRIVKVSQISTSIKLRVHSYMQMEEVLRAIKSEEAVGDLKVSNVSIQVGTDSICDCKELIEWPITLTSLRLSGCFYNLQDLFNRHAPTLEELHYEIGFCIAPKPETEVVLPKFPKLKVLNILCNTYRTPGIKFILPPVYQIQTLFPLIKVDSKFLILRFYRYYNQNKRDIKAFLG